MKDYTQKTQSIELRQQASMTYMSIASLRKEIDEAKAQLGLELSASNSEASKELRDRIFGYRIEIEALEVRAHRLLKQARDQDTAHV